MVIFSREILLVQKFSHKKSSLRKMGDVLYNTFYYTPRVLSGISEALTRDVPVDFLSSLLQGIDDTVALIRPWPQALLLTLDAIRDTILVYARKLGLKIAAPLGVFIDLFSLFAMTKDKTLILPQLLTVEIPSLSRIRDSLGYTSQDDFIPPPVLLYEYITNKKIPDYAYHKITETNYYENLRYSPLVIRSASQQFRLPYCLTGVDRNNLQLAGAIEDIFRQPDLTTRSELLLSMGIINSTVEPYVKYGQFSGHVSVYTGVATSLTLYTRSYGKVFTRPRGLPAPQLQFPREYWKLPYNGGTVFVNPFVSPGDDGETIEDLLRYYTDLEIEDAFFAPGFINGPDDFSRPLYVQTLYDIYQEAKKIHGDKVVLNNSLIQELYLPRLVAQIPQVFTAITASGDQTKIGRLYRILLSLYKEYPELSSYYTQIRELIVNRNKMINFGTRVGLDVSDIIGQYYQ